MFVESGQSLVLKDKMATDVTNHPHGSLAGVIFLSLVLCRPPYLPDAVFALDQRLELKSFLSSTFRR